jgi:hypothetical protein
MVAAIATAVPKPPQNQLFLQASSSGTGNSTDLDLLMCLSQSEVTNYKSKSDMKRRKGEDDVGSDGVDNDDHDDDISADGGDPKRRRTTASSSTPSRPTMNASSSDPLFRYHETSGSKDRLGQTAADISLTFGSSSSAVAGATSNIERFPRSTMPHFSQSITSLLTSNQQQSLEDRHHQQHQLLNQHQSAAKLEVLRRLNAGSLSAAAAVNASNNSKDASDLSRLLMMNSSESTSRRSAQSSASYDNEHRVFSPSSGAAAAAAPGFLPRLNGGDMSLLQHQLALSSGGFGTAAATAAGIQQRQTIDQFLRSTLMEPSASSSSPYDRSVAGTGNADGMAMSSSSSAAAAAAPTSSNLPYELLRLQLARSGGNNALNRWPSPLSSTATGTGMSSALAGNVNLYSLRSIFLHPQQQQNRSSSLPGRMDLSSSADAVSAHQSYADYFGFCSTTNLSRQSLLQQLALSQVRSANDPSLALGSTSRYQSGASLSSPSGSVAMNKNGVHDSETDMKKIKSSNLTGKKRVAGFSCGDLPKRSSTSKPFVPTTMHFMKNELLSDRLPFPKSPPEPIAHYSERPFVPLATDEDQNWLSDLLCFVRSELVEVFRATDKDVRQRNKSKRVRLGQVGLRCRFCAHIPQGGRVGRSSSFPSSLDRIYQSLTMMLRDHFARCTIMPSAHQERFIELKRRTTQGATDSKQYWVHSAREMGLEDTETGIWVCKPVSSAVNDHSSIPSTIPSPAVANTAQLKDPTPTETTLDQTEPVTPLKTDDTEKESVAVNETQVEIDATTGTQLVFPEDEGSMSPLLYLVLSHVQLVQMDKSEQTGNRKSLPVGLPGLACIHCCQSGRRGLCRIFPSRRRTLTNKIDDLYQHFLKCTLCPSDLKQKLDSFTDDKAPTDASTLNAKKDRAFVEKLWTRMGHGTTFQDA